MSKTKTKGFGLECGNCGTICFTAIADRRLRKENAKRVSCVNCGGPLSSTNKKVKLNRAARLKYHDREKPLSCPTCGGGYNTMKGLSLHRCESPPCRAQFQPFIQSRGVVYLIGTAFVDQIAGWTVYAVTPLGNIIEFDNFVREDDAMDLCRKLNRWPVKRRYKQTAA